MARDFGVPIDMNGFEIWNLVFQNLASAPGSPKEGQVYYNTVDDKPYIYANGAWVGFGSNNTGTGDMNKSQYDTDNDGKVDASEDSDLLQGQNGAYYRDRANHSGTQSADTLTDGTDRKAYTATERTKLAGVAEGATANDTDANLKNRANHTGTQSADTIVDGSTNKAYTATEKSKLAGIEALADVTDTQNVDAAGAVMTADTDLSGYGFFLNENTLATNSQTKVPSQASVKNYVDNLLQGLSWKPAVRVATTANITLSGTQTIDGVAVVAGDRVLVKNQTTASANGIYVVASGAWSRATDADTSAEIANMTVYVSEGTASLDMVYTLTTNSPTLGTTSLTYALLNGGTVPTASTSVAGKVQLATAAEAEAKSNTAKAVTPAALVNFTKKVTSATIGNGSATSVAVTHNLNTRLVTVEVFDNATYETVEVDVTRTDANTVTLGFGAAPASNAYSVVIVG